MVYRRLHHSRACWRLSYGLVVLAGTWGVHGTPRLRGICRRDVEAYPLAESLLDLIRVLAEE